MPQSLGAEQFAVSNKALPVRTLELPPICNPLRRDRLPCVALFIVPSVSGSFF
jgi:hypothetical protein